MKYVEAAGLRLSAIGVGTWQFGEYVIPSAHLPLKRILPIRPHAIGQAAGAPGSVSQ